MSNLVSSPIIYDFHSKSLKDLALNKKTYQDVPDFKGIPAEIVGVSEYEELQCVDVKFLIDDLYVERDNMVLESMTLKRKFVALQRSGGFSIKQPVAVGDLVRLHWSHRDLGGFLDGDGSAITLNVNEIGKRDDFWVELGFGTRRNHVSPSVENFIIEGPNTTVTITPTGEVTLVNLSTTFKIDTEGNVTLTTNGNSSITSASHTINAPTTINNTLTVVGASTLSAGVTVAGVANLPVTTITGGLAIDGKNVQGHDHNGEVTPM